MLLMFVMFLQFNLHFSVFDIRLTLHFSAYYMRFTIEAAYNRENTNTSRNLRSQNINCDVTAYLKTLK